MQDGATKRKLTTILAADVVGYSRAMAVAEEATHATLRAYREITDAIVAKYDGRVFNTAGDAFLAEFGSTVEAVRCAIAIQEDLALRNAKLPEERQMWFRIGVNVGDVMIQGDDLFGHGVNVAARLEGLAEPGGICISGSTFEQVKNRISIAFDDIGAQRVKNIPEPVPAYRIVPGQAAVIAAEPPAAAPRRPRTRWILGGGAALAALALAAYLGLFTRGNTPSAPFDGAWRVDVTGLSGCLDDSPRSFVVHVRNGRIDEPKHRLPKTGTVTDAGALTLRVVDEAGDLMNTQVATLSGDRGAGRFEGRRATCVGDVALARVP